MDVFSLFTPFARTSCPCLRKRADARIPKFAAFLLIALSAPPIALHAADANAVLAVARARTQSADYRITGRLVHVDAVGARTSYGITIKAHWFPGVLRVLLAVNSPAVARARVLLEMRPNGQDSIFLAKPGDTAPAPLPFSGWSNGPAGNEFSYEDFLEPEYFWPTQTLVKEEHRGTRDCVVVKSTPGASDRTHYAYVESSLDKTIGFPVYAEKTVKGSGAVKEFTYVGLRHEGGVWSASQVKAAVRGKPGSTLLIIEHGSAKAHLGPNDFSPAAMTQFEGGL